MWCDLHTPAVGLRMGLQWTRCGKQAASEESGSWFREVVMRERRVWKWVRERAQGLFRGQDRHAVCFAYSELIYRLIQLIYNIILKHVFILHHSSFFWKKVVSCLLMQNMTDLPQWCSAATRLGPAEPNKSIYITISKSNSTAARLRRAAVVLTQLRYRRSLSSEMEPSAEKQELTQIYNIPSPT